MNGMLTIRAPATITKFSTMSSDTTCLLRETLPVHVLNSCTCSKAHSLRGYHYTLFFPSKHYTSARSRFLNKHPFLDQQAASSKAWMCRNSFDDDDDYRSSRSIAITLFRRYRNFNDRGGGDNLKEFIRAGVNAYALGCTDEGLRKELDDIKQSDTRIESTDSTTTYGGNTSLKSKIIVSDEINECILWLGIVFITILCTPQPTIVRWSAITPVSDGLKLRWKGFCALIANAYFIRGMAWLPVKTLQLEQMAVTGRTEEPAVVASRMLLVFTTLEVVSPQWPIV